MPIKLLVTHAGDAAPPDEYVFEHETVMIGRDNANLLTLPDPARLISKHHAEIRETDVGFELVDLGSKNFTYLNGKRLTSGQPALLNPGDRFKIGEFEVVFYPEAPADPEENRTVFVASFVNPFEEPAEKLAEVLGSLRRVYAGESGPRRSDALRDALEAALIGGGDEPGAIVARQLSGGEESFGMVAMPAAHVPPPAAPFAAPPEPMPPRSPEPPPAAYGAADPFAQTSASAFAPFLPPPSFAPPPLEPPGPASPAYAPPAPTPPPAYVPPPAQAPPPAYAPMSGSISAGEERLLDVLIEAVSKLAPIPWRFRHEFIGQTIVQTSESAFLYEKPPAELKAYLTDPQADDAERERRLAAMAEAVEAVAVHQLAMLDGYKASVQQGAQRLLDKVDPAPIEAEVEASSPMYKVPQFRSSAVLERLKEAHRELGGEDWSVAERRAFRPAFIKAYLARMTRRRS